MGAEKTQSQKIPENVAESAVKATTLKEWAIARTCPVHAVFGAVFIKIILFTRLSYYFAPYHLVKLRRYKCCSKGNKLIPNL